MRILIKKSSVALKGIASLPSDVTAPLVNDRYDPIYIVTKYTTRTSSPKKFKMATSSENNECERYAGLLNTSILRALDEDLEYDFNSDRQIDRRCAAQKTSSDFVDENRSSNTIYNPQREYGYIYKTLPLYSTDQKASRMSTDQHIQPYNALRSPSVSQLHGINPNFPPSSLNQIATEVSVNNRYASDVAFKYPPVADSQTHYQSVSRPLPSSPYFQRAEREPVDRPSPHYLIAGSSVYDVQCQNVDQNSTSPWSQRDSEESTGESTSSSTILRSPSSMLYTPYAQKASDDSVDESIPSYSGFIHPLISQSQKEYDQNLYMTHGENPFSTNAHFESISRASLKTLNNYRINPMMRGPQTAIEFTSSVKKFGIPNGFCLDHNGNYIVADTKNNLIQVLSSDGLFIRKFGFKGVMPGMFNGPRKVAQFHMDTDLVISDMGNQRSRLQIFHYDGTFRWEIKIEFIEIVAGLVTTNDDKIVVVDSKMPLIYFFDKFGAIIRIVNYSKFISEPSDIAISNDTMYITDFRKHRVILMDHFGLNCKSFAFNDCSRKFPNGIAIGPNGCIVVGDSHGNNFVITFFSPTGETINEIRCSNIRISRSVQLLITASGDVVTLAKNNNKIIVVKNCFV